MFDTDESMLMRVGVMVDILSDSLVRTVNRDVSDIRVLIDLDVNLWVTVTTVLELIKLSTSSKELLLFCWTAFCTCPITILDCCALQAWMPSYHVC